MNHGTKLAWAGVALAAVMLPSAPVGAQTFPAKPIRIVVTFPPGGTTDILAREIGARMQESWGQSVIIDNRPGAGGNIGADIVAKAAPDGHTLLLGTNGTHGINSAIYAKMPYDPIKDFAPVTWLASVANIFISHPSVPVKTMKELVALARTRPGQIVYGSSGTGTPQHLSVELFKSMAKIDLVHIPYKGASPAVLAVLTGEVAFSCPSLPSAGIAAHVGAGRMRGLAVTGAKRSAAFVQVPTMIESGYPGFDVVTSFGILASGGTPAEIVGRLNKEIVRILALPASRERLMAQGIELVGSTPADYATHIRGELARWVPIVKDAGIKVD